MTTLLPKLTHIFVAVITILATTAGLVFPKILAQGAILPSQKVHRETSTNASPQKHVLYQAVAGARTHSMQNNSVQPTPAQSINTFPLSSPTPSQTGNIPNSQVNTVTNTKILEAKSTISMQGKTITLALSYPNTGGAIIGTLTGDCSGTVSGNYNGPQTGKLSGSAKATCPESFLSVPVDITYTGKLENGVTEAMISYTVSALGQTSSGTTNLILSQ